MTAKIKETAKPPQRGPEEVFLEKCDRTEPKQKPSKQTSHCLQKGLALPCLLNKHVPIY